LILSAAAWADLAACSEALAAETLAAEHELIDRPDLLKALTLPRKCRKALSVQAAPATGIARVMRFDFHPTQDGWALSEVNCDVPGGFIEATGFAGLMARKCGLDMTGDPTAALVDAVARPDGPVGLVHATAYLDDRQVMLFLQMAFEARGLEALLISPDDVRWADGRARVQERELAALFRFFPGEWLPNLDRATGWTHYFRGARTPICNPAGALAAQSKRLPLVWDKLTTAMPTWRKLLPETRHPRDVDAADPAWVLKAALGRVGDEVGIRGVTSDREQRKIDRWARRRPRYWIAQRRFDAVAIDAPGGAIYPCVGVYTVDGKAAGIYGRAAAKPLVDGRARDVAVLLEGAGHVA
jgi:glutathionylspermidine synthase